MRVFSGNVASSSRDGHAESPLPIRINPCLSKFSNAARWFVPNPDRINSASRPSQIGPNELMAAHKWKFRGTDKYLRALAVRSRCATCAKAEESSNGTRGWLEVTSPSVGSGFTESSNDSSAFDEAFVTIMDLHVDTVFSFELPFEGLAKMNHSHLANLHDLPFDWIKRKASALTQEVP